MISTRDHVLSKIMYNCARNAAATPSSPDVNKPGGYDTLTRDHVVGAAVKFFRYASRRAASGANSDRRGVTLPMRSSLVN